MSENTSQKPRRTRSIELIAAASFGVLAVGCFIWQGLTVGTHPTATETLLFDSLQFILTAGFAWFSTRAVSRMEFEESLKKFAISAHRRIADIERMIEHLHQEIREMISLSPKTESGNLRIIDAIVSDTAQLVRSSISDWGDVIGEELLAIEKIKRLEQEKERLKESDSSEEPYEAAALKKIEERIATILSTLPPRLQLEAESEQVATVATRQAAEWLARKHEDDKGLQMTVVTGDLYLHERDRHTLVPGEILVTEKDRDGKIDVRDRQGLGVGRLLNSTPLTYFNFVRGFEFCFGNAPVSLEFLCVVGERKGEDGFYAWLDVRVRTQPVLPQRGKRRSSPAAEGKS